MRQEFERDNARDRIGECARVSECVEDDGVRGTKALRDSDCGHDCISGGVGTDYGTALQKAYGGFAASAYI